MNHRGYTSAVGGPGLAGGFEASFTIPYNRENVFAEVVKFSDPLAADVDIRYTLHGAPKEPTPPTISVGMQRKAEFLNPEIAGYTISQCVALEPGRMVKWRQLESKKKGMNLLGADGKMPEVTITLSDHHEGCNIKLAYDFASVSGGDADQLKTLVLTTAKDLWSSAMALRV